MTKPVITENKDGVFTITLNRPEKRNALSGEMYGLLCDALKTAGSDAAVRVVVLTGAGDGFTAGNDLKQLAAAGMGQKTGQKTGQKMDQQTDQKSGQKPQQTAPVLQLMEIMIDFEKPVIAAVHGPAVGIGTTLLLHCDLVIAGQGSTFALPFTRLGLVPEFAASLLLPLLGGRVRAAHTLLLGEAFGTEQARELGIVSEVCEDGQVQVVAARRASTLAALPPRALRETKRLINSPELKARMRQAIEAESTAFMAGLESAEHKEAVGAFFAKRSPDFSRFN